MIRPKVPCLWPLFLLIPLIFAMRGVTVFAMATASDSINTTAALATPTDADDAFSVQASAVPWEARHGLTDAQFQATFDDLTSRGYRLINISGYAINNEARYAAIWEQSAGPAWVARHGITAVDYQATFDNLTSQGYRLVQVSGFALNNEERYSAIWELRDGPAWVARHGITAADYQATFDDLTNQGYRPVQVSGFAINNEARYSAIWELSNGPAWVARHGITAADYQTIFDDLTSQGYRPVQTSGFAIDNEARYIALWELRGGAAWVARHGISATDYQATVDDLSLKGYRPLLVTGFGLNNEDRYSTLWEQTSEPFTDLPKTGNAVPELAVVDQVMHDFMVARQITAGTLAIMKDGEIVFERGYGWQDRQRTVLLPPNAMLRLASVVKPVTAAAIRTLIAEDRLNADDRVFCLTGSPASCILNITPSGTEDANAVNITIQHLLDHMGGWDRAISGDPMFEMNEIATDLGVANPPTKQNIVEYMLGQPLDHVPGTTYAYSNFGYLLLGLVVEDITDQSFTTYVQNTLFAPLCVKEDIELGRSLPNQRNPREPWYSDPNTTSSVFDPSQTVIFPDGGYYIEAMEAHGGLIASGRAMAEFLQAYWITGEPRTDNTQDWTFFGSLPGTHTMVRQRTDGVNVVALFNQRVDPSGANYEMIKDLLDNAINSITTWPTSAHLAQACLFPLQSILVDNLGATLNSLDAKTSVIFPPNVVSSPISVTFAPKLLTVGDGFRDIDQFFELNAEDENGDAVTTFQNPITIVSQLPQDLGGLNADSFRLYWLDGDAWHTDGLSTVSLEGNTLTSTTTHFTTFAVLAEVEPDEDPDEELENALYMPILRP